MKYSIWRESVNLPRFHSLQGAHKTDVLIIGGGLCGVLCAYFLEKAGVDYILAEADAIGSGTTGNTTAKITSQHGLIYHDLINSVGREKAQLYLRANEQALEEYRKLAVSVECDFEEKDGYVYTLSDREKIEREVQAVNSLGFPAEFAENLRLPMETRGAVRFPGQAQFHPLKFLSQIAGGLHIYDHTMIRDLAPHRGWSEQGEIAAEKIIVTTHFPFLNKHGNYFLKLYQHRSYVLALKHAQDVNGMYVDEAQNGLSFRNYKEILLVGGGGHRTGKTGGNWQELRRFAGMYYPEAEETGIWAAQDCMPLDKIPYIGPYSPHTPDLYVASGFQKWGMTTAMVAAQLLTDLVLEKDNPFGEVFSPGRSIWKPQLFLNGAEAVSNLLTFSGKRCPHMGCALKWNPAEHSWDCPCHGSRFEEDGTLLNNPAVGPANVKKSQKG